MTKALMATTVFFLYAAGWGPADPGRKAPKERDGCQSERKEEKPKKSSASPPMGGASVPASIGAEWGEPCEATSDCSQTGERALDCVEGECAWACETSSAELECDSAGGTCYDGSCFPGG